MVTKAYSYLRFSTPEQIQGHSLERQALAAVQYAKDHDLDLDDHLTFRDLGVSGFHGKNAQEGGALGAFIDAVDSGLVPAGSYLLVESLDRLSRQDVLAAFDLFRSILKREIHIVTLHDGRHYSPGQMDFADLIISLAVMQRANEESLTKSKRLASVWKAKRQRAVESGHKLTSRTPGWLKMAEDRSLHLIPDRAKIIQRIFKETIEGRGAAMIARGLNQDGVEPFNGAASGWHPSYLFKILNSEATIGILQPNTMKQCADGKRRRVADGPAVEGYYPQVIDASTFYKAKAVRKSRMIPTGRAAAKMSNLFTGLAVCGQCGSPMHFENKTSKDRSRPATYLVCRSARMNTGCQRFAWKYAQTQCHIILNLLELDFREIFPQVYQSIGETRRMLEDELRTAHGELERVSKSLESIIQNMIDRPQSPTLIKALDALEAKQAQLTTKITSLQAEATRASSTMETITKDFESTGEALHRLLDIETSGSPEQVLEIRLKLHQLLKKVVDKITLDKDKMEIRLQFAGQPDPATIQVSPDQTQSRSDMVTIIDAEWPPGPGVYLKKGAPGGFERPMQADVLADG